MSTKQITAETVAYLAFQARIALGDARAARMLAQLNTELDAMDVLGGIEIEGVEPMTHVFPAATATRPDELRASCGREALLRNAPVRTEESCVVPKTVE